VFRLGPIIRRNPGLNSETWATHSFGKDLRPGAATILLTGDEAGSTCARTAAREPDHTAPADRVVHTDRDLLNIDISSSSGGLWAVYREPHQKSKQNRQKGFNEIHVVGLHAGSKVPFYFLRFLMTQVVMQR